MKYQINYNTHAVIINLVSPFHECQCDTYQSKGKGIVPIIMAIDCIAMLTAL